MVAGEVFDFFFVYIYLAFSHFIIYDCAFLLIPIIVCFNELFFLLLLLEVMAVCFL